jgi:hypothetical protein
MAGSALLSLQNELCQVSDFVLNHSLYLGGLVAYNDVDLFRSKRLGCSANVSD